MLVNQGTAISTSGVLLVPYEKSHVLTYHEWMKDKEIQEQTASEPLSLEEEFEMQRKWRQDHDKLSFIICLPVRHPFGREHMRGGDFDRSDRMIGDVNLFIHEADEDSEGCIGELEIMIAPEWARRNGHGRAAILSFIHYIQSHVSEIVGEYRVTKNSEKMRLLQLMVKIGNENEKSINLFQSIGFVKVSENPNVFKEFQLVLEGSLSSERTKEMLENFHIENYHELHYEE